MSGIGHYFHDILQGDSRSVLGATSSLIFVGFVIIFEAIFRIRNKWALGHIKTPNPVLASNV